MVTTDHCLYKVIATRNFWVIIGTDMWVYVTKFVHIFLFYLRTHQCELSNVTIFYLCVGFLQDLDLQCEELIKEEFGAECNFDVHDAVKKLEKLGIIHRVNLSTNSFCSKYLARTSLYRSRQLKFGSAWIVLGCWNLFLCVVTCVAVKTFSSYKSTYLGCISQLSLLPIFFLSCSAFRTKWE
jgi:hypothetical protein